jgi:anionic cell wall polymer biosynthesis LytR-Cps2A-Psr (LCP) family protein
VNLDMKKLIIAVIVLSFFGFGPLQSFFQSSTEKEGEEAKSIPFLEKLKDSSESEKKVETFLIIENRKGSTPSTTEPGLLLKYDKDHNKIEYGSIMLALDGKEGELEQLKKQAAEKYQVDIDYCFIYDTSGFGTVIDLISPNGIEMETGNEGHLDGERQILKGEDFVQYLVQLKMNPGYAKELSPIFMALKEEILKEISTEDFLTIAPQILNETLKNVKTDIGKGKLMDLGLTVMMNPVTSIEQIELVATNKDNKLENVNKMLEGEQGFY